MTLSVVDSLLLRREGLIPIGLAIASLIALALSSETHLAIGLLLLLALIVSVIPVARVGILILLLPFAHAGLGLEALPGFGLYDAYAAFFLLLFVIRFAVREVFQFDRIPVLGLTGIMFLAFIPSILNSVDLRESFKALLQFLVSALTAAGVYYYLAREQSEKIFLSLLTLFFIEAALIAGYGIVESTTSSSLLGVVTGRVYFGPFQDVNYYASYLLMAFALAGGFIVIAKGVLLRLASAAAFVILLASVVSTVSRSGIATLILVSLFFTIYLGLSLRGARKLLGVSFLLLFIGIISVLIFSGVGSKVVDMFTLSRRLETVVAGKDPSMEQRSKILEVGTRVVAAHPIIGVGFGAFEKAFDDYKGAEISTGSSRAAHNTALRILGETGLVGFIPSIVFVFVFLRYLIRAYRKIPDRRRRILMASVVISICAFLLMSLALDMMFEPHFWVMVGLSLALASRYVVPAAGLTTPFPGSFEQR